jgi:hypothetical protein
MADGFSLPPFDINRVLLSNPLTAPLSAAAALFGGFEPSAKTPQQEALEKAQQRQRGQKAYLNKEPVFWDDKATDPTQAWLDIKEYYEKYGTPPRVAKEDLAPLFPQQTAAATGTSGTSTDDDLDTGEAPKKPSLPPTTGPKEQTEPVIDQATKFSKEILEQYVPYELLRNKLLSQQSVLNAAIAQQGREQLTRRQLETENIRAWRDLETKRLETQAQQAAAVASVAYLAQQPNVSTMQAFNEAFKAASAPLPNLRGG